MVKGAAAVRFCKRRGCGSNPVQLRFSERDTQVGDITYIRTDEGWLYLATVKDLCTKKIVGYAFSERIDANLVVAALSMAYTSLPFGFIQRSAMIIW